MLTFARRRRGHQGQQRLGLVAADSILRHAGRVLHRLLGAAGAAAVVIAVTRADGAGSERSCNEHGSL